MIRHKSFKIYSERAFICTLFLLYITKYMCVGFKYFPVLDDHIQYYWYKNAYENIGEVFWGIGTLSSRPLAGIADVYFWSNIFNFNTFTLVAVAVISFLGVHFICLALKDMDIYTGAVLYIFLLFLPVCNESQYWLSASSRIMVSIFLSGLSLRAYSEYIKRENAFLFILFWILNLFSLCFYEQTAIFSCLFCAAYFYCLKEQSKPYTVLIINASLVIIYYIIFGRVGSLGGRGEIIFSPQIFSRLVIILKELYNVIVGENFKLITSGLSRIRELFLSVKWSVFTAGILSVMASVLYTSKIKANRTGSGLILLGIVVFIFSAFPFAFTGSFYISYRTAYVPLIGIAFILSGLFFGKKRYNRRYIISKKVVLAAVLFILSVTSISEIYDYKAVSLIDKQIASSIASEFDNGRLDKEKECYVYGAKRCYADINSLYGEHILNITSSDWALTGAVRRYGNMYVKRLVPVHTNEAEIEDGNSQIIEICEDYSINILRGQSLPGAEMEN